MSGADAEGRHLTRLVDRVLRVLALASGAVLLGLMALIVTDVALRYVFNAPIFGGQDVAELALLTTVALAVAYCGRSGGHVAVDLIGGVLSQRLARVLDGFVRLVSAAILAVVVWRCFINGLDAAAYGEASNLLNLPFLPFYFLLSFGFAVYVTVLLLEAVGFVEPPGANGKR